MEQTLGGRISAWRKKKKLTQDQLAEKLGVTPQAVSKWENDQSCPDITMLPRLAEIFGSTTDELLGIEATQKVLEAEVITDEDPATDDGLHITRGGFEFKLDRGTRKGSIGFAVLILAVGGLYLAAQLLQWDVSFWGILWPTTLLVFGIFGSMPWVSFGSLICTGFGAYFLLDNLNILPFELGWKLVLPVAMLLFGTSLLVKSIRRPRSRTVKFNDNGEHITSSCTTDGETFSCDNSFCSKNYRIDLPRLTSGYVNISFGDTTVDLSGIEAIAENCAVEVNTSFGESTILVPRKYHVALARNAAFGAISVHGEPAPAPEGTIRITANVSFGEININYI